MDFLEQDIVIVSANPTCILRWIEILRKWRMYVSLRDENLIQALDASLDYIIGQKLNQKKKKKKCSDMYWQGYYLSALSRYELIRY